MLLNSKKQCQGHFGQVEILLRDAASGKQCWCQLRGAAQEHRTGRGCPSSGRSQNTGLTTEGSRNSFQPHAWRRPGDTAQGFPLRLLHALMGSARQQHKAHAEHTRLSRCSLAWSSAIQRKQEQLPLLQSSPNPGNSRKQLQRGAVRKKEG